MNFHSFTGVWRSVWSVLFFGCQLNDDPTTWSWKSRLGVKLSPRFGAGCGTWQRYGCLQLTSKNGSNQIYPQQKLGNPKIKISFGPNLWFLHVSTKSMHCWLLPTKKSTLPKTHSLPHENRPLLPQRKPDYLSNHSFSGANSLFSFREGIPILEGHEAYLTP